ncbi:TPA: hypothetical protein I0F87_RS13275, partial [Enterococcus faecalis]|nr:hypothetical protein [Enterococcus faecalis]
ITYGYFHLQTPEPGEIIFVYTQSHWSSQYKTFGKSKGNYEPTMTSPTEPTPPMYEIVPNVPDEPVPPIPPVKPVYESLNKVTLFKLDKETNKPLANAEFKLTDTINNENLGIFVSNKDGLVQIENLNPGNYMLTETKAPEGYVLDNTPISFVVQGTENEKVQLKKFNIPETSSNDKGAGTTSRGSNSGSTLGKVFPKTGEDMQLSAKLMEMGMVVLAMAVGAYLFLKKDKK